MKRLLVVVMAVLLMLTGCSAPSDDDDKVSIVTTIFPLYDWIMEITAGIDDVEITLLQEGGTDLHNYQPTVADMVRVSECDIFVYVGGESDRWVEDALKTAVNPEMKVVNLMEAISDRLFEEEEKEGMEKEDHREEEAEYDEHIWLSLRNARECVREIGKVISEVTGDSGEIFKKTSGYINKLNRLDKQYRNLTESSAKKVLLFADRFPFIYLFRDYGIDYYAAFKGCSAESEASFETVSFLAGKVSELQLDHVMILENGNRKLAETIIRDSSRKDCNIEELNSMQSALLQDGLTYLDIMENNLKVLERVLN